MGVIIYQTEHPEDAIDQLYRCNTKAQVYEYYRNRRRITIRKDLLGHIPSQVFIGQPRLKGKLLWNRYSWKTRTPLPCDGLYLPECPHSLQDLKRINTATREVVIYRPPNWELHLEAIALRNPQAYLYPTLCDIVVGLADRPKSDIDLNLIDLYGWDAQACAVFTRKEMMQLMGLPHGTLHILLRRAYGLRMTMARLYDLYWTPEDPIMRQDYEHLQTFPEVRPNLVAIPYGRAGVPLQRLRIMKNIAKHNDTYIIKSAKKLPNVDRLKTSTSVVWENWYEMQHLIERAPYYV